MPTTARPCSRAGNRRSTELRVAVVGAGLAGLAAAHELREAGAEVEVFEARERVGGRIRSVPFAGGVAEAGAEFILPEETELAATAERLGLTLVRKGTKYGNREVPGLPADGLTGGFAAIDPPAGGTVLEALGRSGLPSAVAEAIRARVEVSCGHPADDLDAGMLDSAAAAFGDFDSYTIEGGNDRLPGALATGLGDALHLSAAVTSVRCAGREVRLRAGELETAADAVVVAVPASVIGSIEFDPALQPRRVAFGQAAKLFIALRSAAPPSATLSVPGRFWCWTQLGADGQPLSFVGAFAGTRGALESLRVGEGPECWIEELAALRPDLELDPGHVLLCTWHDDPWVRGAYSARSPGSHLGTPAPVGPIHFAGEHTAGELHGLMEGALRSGRRAAAAITGR